MQTAISRSSRSIVYLAVQLFLALSSLLRQHRGIEKTRIWLDYFLDGNEKKRMVRKISGKYKKKDLT
jgi:hypothetical protein